VDSEFDIKTRVTALDEIKASEKDKGNDCLVIVYAPTPESLGKRFILDKDSIIIGRDRENDIVLNSDSISRRHCRIEYRGTRIFAVDLDSTNGTFVNDEPDPITDILLRRGDLIKIGDTIFKYIGGSDVEAQYHETIYKMTITDHLTGVGNKRFLLETLDREIPRAQRHSRNLSALMMDIDLFKEVNDTYGHLVGDALLKEIATIVRAKLRPDDTFVRYGGDEFAAVLPETLLQDAVNTAERLRQIVMAHEFTIEGESIKVTISIGVIEFQKGWANDQLIKAADEMLYQAKHDGRNCVRPQLPRVEGDDPEKTG
jgi:two-component system cell cycle response regulator